MPPPRRPRGSFLAVSSSCSKALVAVRLRSPRACDNVQDAVAFEQDARGAVAARVLQALYVDLILRDQEQQLLGDVPDGAVGEGAVVHLGKIEHVLGLQKSTCISMSTRMTCTWKRRARMCAQ